MSPCPSHTILQRLLAEQLDEAERQAVEAHVESCRDCQAALAGLAGDSALGPCRRPVAAVPGPGPQPPSDFVWRLKVLSPAPLAGPAPGNGEAHATPRPQGQAAERDGEEWPRVQGYEILSELGRGGMGVVYEAVEAALGRRVALKVLARAAALDARQLQRFRNEAHAAACLEHEHIAPVYAVGSDHGVHYYAMRLIEGRTLADVVTELRQQAGREEADAGEPTAAETSAQAAGTPPGSGDGPAAASAPASPPARPEPGDAEPPGIATAPGLGTGPAAGRPYFRRVAELGLQAAEALEYAHQLGVVHRDVKPGNLMLDGQGRLWVTDFGLAHVRGSAKLTATGDLLGTLPYMSPEQARGGPEVADPRTDIYSLGVTLYELLTLERAFGGSDCEEVLRRIAQDEPRAPRRINKAIPWELETVVLKAMAKAPGERYATARELAEDLRNFLEDRPVRARRPSWARRARKWARRHRALVGAAAAVLLVAAVLGCVAGVWRAEQRAAAAQEAKIALSESERLHAAGKLREALRGVRGVKPLTSTGLLSTALQRRVPEREADLEMAVRLEDMRLQEALGDKKALRWAPSDAAYAKAFQQYGIDVTALSAAEAAERLRTREIRVELAEALTRWALVRRLVRPPGDTTWKDLLALARAADPDPWRDRLREALALEKRDSQALKEMAAAAQAADLPPSSADLLGGVLRDSGAVEQAAALLRQAQRRHPGDFWLNNELAMALERLSPPRWEEALRYYTAAIALRPDSAGAHLNLGSALLQLREVEGNEARRKGLLDEAIAATKEAIRLQPDFAFAHNNLGIALANKGKLDEAVAAYRAALRLQPDYPEAHNNLGNALWKQGRGKEAEAEYREALRLKKDYPEAHHGLGVALREQGRGKEAEAEYREALRLKKDSPEAHFNLGTVLLDNSRPEEAIAEYREGLRLKPDDPDAHNNLGIALANKGKLDEAVAAYRAALRLQPDYPEAHNNLGNALWKQGRGKEAEAEYREALRLKKDYPEAHNNLGAALFEKGALDEAVAECRAALRLKPDYPDAHNNLGNALGQKGALEEAIAEYRVAVRLQPDNARAHYNLGVALGQKGELDEAVAAYRAVVRLQPEYQEAHCNLAWALKQQGALDEAARACKEAIRLASKEPIRLEPLVKAHINLGEVFQRKGARDEAVAAYRAAVCLAPTYSVSHYALGIALGQKGALDEAVAALREALRLEPRLANAYSALGYVLWRKGARDEALAAYRQAIRLQPDKGTIAAPWHGGHEPREPDEPSELLVLAMAYARTGDREKARDCYEQAARLVAKTKLDDPEVRRLTEEARNVLGLPDQRPPRRDERKPRSP